MDTVNPGVQLLVSSFSVFYSFLDDILLCSITIHQNLCNTTVYGICGMYDYSCLPILCILCKLYTLMPYIVYVFIYVCDVVKLQ